MKLHPKYVVEYPTFADYVRRVLPTQARSTLIVDAAARYGQLTPQMFFEAIKSGTAPLIVVTDIPGAAGAFHSKLPGCIAIDVHVVQEYESGVVRRFYCKDGRPLDAPGVVLLHELMHWGDYAPDQTLGNGPGPYHLHEGGEDFELYILGGIAQVPAGPA